jgi:hypothetical protein
VEERPELKASAIRAGSFDRQSRSTAQNSPFSRIASGSPGHAAGKFFFHLPPSVNIAAIASETAGSSAEPVRLRRRK